MQEGQAQAPQKGRQEHSTQTASDRQKPEMHKAKHKPVPDAPNSPDSGETGAEEQAPRSRLRIIPPAFVAEPHKDVGEETVAEHPTKQQGRRYVWHGTKPGLTETKSPRK